MGRTDMSQSTRHQVSRFLRQGYGLCEICEKLFYRTSNSQKYCPPPKKCKQIAKNKQGESYYKRHKKEIKERCARYRETHREELLEKSRRYNRLYRRRKMKKYEHMTILVEGMEDRYAIDHKLVDGNVGEDGWRVVGVVYSGGHCLLIMEREKRE